MNTQKALKDGVNVILAKEMDRQDFLKHVGIAVLVVTGLAGAISALSGQRLTVPTRQKLSQGYGSTPYGGKK